jgi:SecD/SecF fusion protein
MKKWIRCLEFKQHFCRYDIWKFVNAYEGKKLGVVQASKVGPTVAEDIKTNAYWQFWAMAIVFLYLWSVLENGNMV